MICGEDPFRDDCQCGDVDDDGRLLAADAAELRDLFAGLSGPLAAPQKCNVRGPADAGVTDCDLVDLVAIERALAGRPPGVQQVCSPAQP